MASERLAGRPTGVKLVSTGVAGVDFLLGGGLPGGAVVLLEESKRTCGYADALAKLFLAEGLYQNHRIFFASDGTVSCSEFLQTLPQAVIDAASNDVPVGFGGQTSSSANPMEIAFRYEHLPVKNTQVASENRRQLHHFDFTRPVSADCLLSYKHLVTFNASEVSQPSEGRTQYDSIRLRLQNLLFNSHPSEENSRWHRIVVRNIASPLWRRSLDRASVNSKMDVIHFLASLRAFMRQKSTAIAFVTLSTAFVEDGSPLLHRIRQLSDVVFRLDPIDIGEKEKSSLDYHGIFRCLRTPSINSISFPIPDCADYAFKLKRKEFLIERLHLPPDLSETASRAQLDTVSCASGSSRSKLDF